MNKLVYEGQYFTAWPLDEARVDDSYEEVCAMRLLWRAVMDRMLADLVNPATTQEAEAERAQAQLWLEDRIVWRATSPGFSDVCDLAGLDPDWAHTKFKRILEAL